MPTYSPCVFIHPRPKNKQREIINAMWKSKIRAKLDRNEPALITALHFCDPSLYELVSLLGFDGIWLDLEHHAHSD